MVASIVYLVLVVSSVVNASFAALHYYTTRCAVFALFFVYSLSGAVTSIALWHTYYYKDSLLTIAVAILPMTVVAATIAVWNIRLARNALRR